MCFSGDGILPWLFSTPAYGLMLKQTRGMLLFCEDGHEILLMGNY